MEPSTPTTCWMLIRRAAAGDASARAGFYDHYAGLVRAYLHRRWRASDLEQRVEDVAQEVFVECFGPAGPLEKAEPREGKPFRAYLLGVTRIAALRAERAHDKSRRHRAEGAAAEGELMELAREEDRLSLYFEKSWAQLVMREAGERQAERAAQKGDAALRRVELLRLRFDQDLSIPEIAARWGVEADWLHHQYAQAREEFRQALLDVVGFHEPGGLEVVEREARRLMDLLRG